MDSQRIKTMQEYVAEGQQPEYLFWVGCSGSFDPRAQKISVASVTDKSADCKPVTET